MTWREEWEKCVARIKRHKEKCNYNEPEMESILSMDAHVREVEAENKRLREAIEWACGGEGSDFRPRAEGEGAYWWRKELLRRAKGE